MSVCVHVCVRENEFFLILSKKVLFSKVRSEVFSPLCSPPGPPGGVLRYR